MFCQGYGKCWVCSSDVNFSFAFFTCLFNLFLISFFTRTLVFGSNPMFFGGVEDDDGIVQRIGQLSTIDFVGCLRSISINGNEKSLLKDVLNSTGLTNTCNYVEGGACSKQDVCGEYGKI